MNNVRVEIDRLLQGDLNFHTKPSSALSHDWHAFPAKFPPQLPEIFIKQLTEAGDGVLDPMMGSGTTIVEAAAASRMGIGFDIDPLAVLLASTKVRAFNPDTVSEEGQALLAKAEQSLATPSVLVSALARRFDPKTKVFVDYWFSPETQLELEALSSAIEYSSSNPVRDFFRLIFSSIIITKSGGVSLAWDLAHTRPHKLKQGVPKQYKSALKEFRKRLLRNLAKVKEMQCIPGRSFVQLGSATALPLENDSINLVLTSPPYASNAIDYMRAHKFSLVWFGYNIEELTDLRGRYIGGERTADFAFTTLPPQSAALVERIFARDSKKGDTLRRYYTEMQRVLCETCRVLKPGGASIFVVGSATMRGIDTRAQYCLAEIGEQVGLELVGIATRQLDRNRRMMPARHFPHTHTQIEQRMHEEYVVAWVKPLGAAYGETR